MLIELFRLECLAMVDIKLYVFDLVGVRIPVSSLSIRRVLDGEAFCSVTIPNASPFIGLIEDNPTGAMLLSHIINGVEAIVGTFTLQQFTTTASTGGQTVVLNGQAAFGIDQASSGSYTIINPITHATQSNTTVNFSAEENALIVVNDTIFLGAGGFDPVTDEPITTESIVTSIALFVNVLNSRMDVSVLPVVA